MGPWDYIIVAGSIAMLAAGILGPIGVAWRQGLLRRGA